MTENNNQDKQTPPPSAFSQCSLLLKLTDPVTALTEPPSFADPPPGLRITIIITASRARQTPKSSFALNQGGSFNKPANTDICATCVDGCRTDARRDKTQPLYAKLEYLK